MVRGGGCVAGRGLSARAAVVRGAMADGLVRRCIFRMAPAHRAGQFYRAGVQHMAEVELEGDARRDLLLLQAVLRTAETAPERARRARAGERTYSGYAEAGLGPLPEWRRRACDTAQYFCVTNDYDGGSVPPLKVCRWWLNARADEWDWWGRAGLRDAEESAARAREFRQQAEAAEEAARLARVETQHRTCALAGGLLRICRRRAGTDAGAQAGHARREEERAEVRDRREGRATVAPEEQEDRGSGARDGQVGCGRAHGVRGLHGTQGQGKAREVPETRARHAAPEMEPELGGHQPSLVM